MKTKIFTFCLALMLSVGTIHATVLKGSCGGNLTWSLNTENYTLTITGFGMMRNYADPTSSSSSDKVPWYGQSGVYLNYIKYIILPDGLTTIGDHAFNGCRNLSSINIPNSVTTIGKRAFCDCVGLTSVIIPNNITSLGMGTFHSCKNLNNVTISDSMTCIEKGVFAGCSSLTSIEIPHSVTSIGDEAFSGCTSLDSVVITDNLTTIGKYVFTNCNISSINFIGSMDAWCNKTWSPGNIAGNYRLYINDILQENVIIPNSVSSIGSNAFSSCASLINIEIPESVKSIGTSAFYSCKNLISATISNGISSMENSVFAGCGNLTSMVIPNGVTNIGNSVFSYCTSLTSIVIPQSVINIGSATFYNCSSLVSIYNHAEIPQVIKDTYVFEGVNKSACTLYVPAEYVSLHKAADQWKYFNPILPIDGTTTAISNANMQNDKEHKFLRDGQILILRSDKTYTLTGQEVK